MKFKEFKHTPVQPDTYEASMALNQLMRIGKHAIKLHNMIDDAAEMESWVAKKIDLAGDYVKKVYNYTEGEKAGLYDDGSMTESRQMIGDYAREIESGRIVRIVDFTPDEDGDIYTISYGENQGENDVFAKDLKFLDQTGADQEEISKFGESHHSGLRAWFGKGKKGGAGGGGWDRYNTKGERIGKCGDRKKGEGKPKCLSKARAASLRASGGKKAIAAAVRRKRRKDKNPERRGKAINVRNKKKK